MDAVAAANESDQAAAACDEPPPTTPATTAAAASARPLATLDPRLFMAARRGDSRQLKHLLLLQVQEEQGTEKGATTTAADEGMLPVPVAEQVVVVVVVQPQQQQVDDHDPPAAAVPAAPTSAAAAGLSVAAAQDSRRSHEVVAPPPPTTPDAASEYDIVQTIDPQPPHHDAAVAPPPPAVAAAALPRLLEVEDGATIDGDSLLHVVAASGDGEDFLRCAKMLATTTSRGTAAAAKRQQPQQVLLLEARNNKGDTPLHCVAAAGNADMISCLVHLFAITGGGGDPEPFVRLQNGSGETALHQAVRAAENKVACIDRLSLMGVDPDLAYLAREDGASPLYLAISLDEMEIAQHLLHKTQGKLSYSGPDGRNVLHAVVSSGQGLPMVLEWLKTKADDCMQQQQGEGKTEGEGQGEGEGEGGDLLLQLTKQRDNKDGSTPLHLAVSLDGWDWGTLSGHTQVMPPQFWAGSRSDTSLLLDANICAAYQADEQGLYPIHVAARSGCLKTVRILLERCPDCATLRDGQGRTFLHLAACHERYSVVKYACSGGSSSSDPAPAGLSRILNAQDKDGDTALHGAVRAGNVAVFSCLFRNLQVRLGVANNQGMTPLDLSRSVIPSGFINLSNARMVIWRSLLKAGAVSGGGVHELFKKPERDVKKVSKQLTQKMQAMSIVAGLIATVTFAAAFTLPGGYRSDADAAGTTNGNNNNTTVAGTAVLAGTYGFDAFVVADALAFLCSCVAVWTLVHAAVPYADIGTRRSYIHYSWLCLRTSVTSFVAAFALALCLALASSPHHVHITEIWVIGMTLLASEFYVCLQLPELASAAHTLRRPIGSRSRVALDGAREIFFCALETCWPYIIIFGLPAIRPPHKVK